MRFLDDRVDDDVHEVGHVDVHRSGDVAKGPARVDFIHCSAYCGRIMSPCSANSSKTASTQALRTSLL